MKRESWPVTEDHTCPAGGPVRCCYCGIPIAQEHAPGCSYRQRTVVIKATFEIVMRVQENIVADDIEFQLNDSSSCANNILIDIDVIRSHRDCLCELFHGEYVREATPEDEEASRNKIAEPRLIEDEDE